MAYTNSPLVSYTRLSPNHSGQRNHEIDTITPHCVVGQCSVETLGDIFAKTSRQASCQYGIGPDGRVGLYVEEKNRSWCSSSNSNDQRAVTIECASDATAPYAFKDAVYNSLINLCVDICKRNNKNKLIWFGDRDKTLNYKPAPNEMLLTVHRWFAKKSCPGDWMFARMGDLANKVNAKLGSSSAQPVQQPVQQTTQQPTQQTTTTTMYYVQVGAFKRKGNADNLLIKVKTVFPNAFVKQEGDMFKVQLGAFKDKKNADQLVAKAKAAGYKNAFINKK